MLQTLRCNINDAKYTYCAPANLVKHSMNLGKPSDPLLYLRYLYLNGGLDEKQARKVMIKCHKPLLFYKHWWHALQWTLAAWQKSRKYAGSQRCTGGRQVTFEAPLTGDLVFEFNDNHGDFAVRETFGVSFTCMILVER